MAVTSVNVTATLAAPATSTMTINGTSQASGAARTITLGAQGSTTTVTVAVTSQCGVTQNYVLSLVRGTCNANNSLSNLTTSAGSWNTPFASGTYAYTVNEAWNVSSVDVVATVAAGTSSVTINGTAGATRTITLGAQGATTTVTVAVTSECGVTQNYVLSVVRATCSTNNSLSNLDDVGRQLEHAIRLRHVCLHGERGLERELGGRCGNSCRQPTLRSRSTARPVRPRTITLGAQGSTTTVTVAVTSQCGVTQNYVLSVVRATCSTNNSLSALSTTPTGTWNTPFASGTYAYTVNEAWNVSSVDVAATLADTNSTITINGTAGATRTITLGAQGSTTTVTVAVTSQCGVTQNYVLSVVRASCNANNSLSALTASAGTWNTPFASGTYAYTITEAWTVGSVDVTATLAAPATSTMTINGTSQVSGATRSITLGAQGSTTTVTVAVTSECGVTQNYVLSLIRGTCSAVNTLSALTVSDSTLWTPTFASGTTTYHVDVPFGTTSRQCGCDRNQRALPRRT